jgi:hypothetical protein
MLITFVSFFNEVDTETKTILISFVSFFNEVATETQNYPRSLVSFFNELEIRKPYPQSWFHQKTMLKVVSFFNELEIRKPCSNSLFLIMASKRTMLWKDTMSRDKTRSWIPRDLHLMEETHSGRNTCRGSR